MSIRQLMLIEKVQEICAECNYDLRDIKEHLKARYHLPKGYDFSPDMKLFKKIIIEGTDIFTTSDYISEFMEKFGVQTNDD